MVTLAGGCAGGGVVGCAHAAAIPATMTLAIATARAACACALPLPGGERVGVRGFGSIESPVTPSPRPSPPPKSDVSDFGHLNMAQLGNTRVGLGEGDTAATGALTPGSDSSVDAAVSFADAEPCLLIDHHPPRDAANWNRNRGLAGLHVDDRHVVAEAVGHEQLAFVLSERDAPGAF